MGTEENKALVRRFVEEFWNRGGLAAADELMASDVTIHAPVDGGLSGLKAFNAMFRSAFPDWCATAQELVAEGDLVAERWTGRGTHRGELLGIAPTGRPVEVPGVVFYRITNGRIAEFRGQFDRLSLLQQLGVAPAAAV